MVTKDSNRIVVQVKVNRLYTFNLNYWRKSKLFLTDVSGIVHKTCIFFFEIVVVVVVVWCRHAAGDALIPRVVLLPWPILLLLWVVVMG